MFRVTFCNAFLMGKCNSDTTMYFNGEGYFEISGRRIVVGFHLLVSSGILSERVIVSENKFASSCSKYISCLALAG